MYFSGGVLLTLLYNLYRSGKSNTYSFHGKTLTHNQQDLAYALNVTINPELLQEVYAPTFLNSGDVSNFFSCRKNKNSEFRRDGNGDRLLVSYRTKPDTVYQQMMMFLKYLSLRDKSDNLLVAALLHLLKLDCSEDDQPFYISGGDTPITKKRNAGHERISCTSISCRGVDFYFEREKKQ